MLSKHTILFWFENKEEEHKLIEFFQKHNYNCVSYRDKKNFDELLLDTSLQAVSLVIIDLNIKETNAITVCNEIKNRKNITDHPFVIIVSDKAEELTQVTALDLGADDYILRPLKLQLFLKRIETILSRKLIHQHKNNNPQEGLFIDLNSN